MSKEDIRRAILKKHIDAINPNSDGTQAIYNAMAEYAKELSVEFFKWYGVRMVSFMDYFRKMKNNEIPPDDQFEKIMQEYEGKSIDELYIQYLKTIQP